MKLGFKTITYEHKVHVIVNKGHCIVTRFDNQPKE